MRLRDRPRAAHGRSARPVTGHARLATWRSAEPRPMSSWATAAHEPPSRARSGGQRSPAADCASDFSTGGGNAGNLEVFRRSSGPPTSAGPSPASDPRHRSSFILADGAMTATGRSSMVSRGGGEEKGPRAPAGGPHVPGMRPAASPSPGRAKGPRHGRAGAQVQSVIGAPPTITQPTAPGEPSRTWEMLTAPTDATPSVVRTAGGGSLCTWA